MNISVARTTAQNENVPDDLSSHQVIANLITVRECDPNVVAHIVGSFDELEAFVDIIKKNEESDDPEERDPNVVKIEVSHLSDNSKAADAAKRLVDWLENQYDIVEQKLLEGEEE